MPALRWDALGWSVLFWARPAQRCASVSGLNPTGQCPVKCLAGEHKYCEGYRCLRVCTASASRFVIVTMWPFSFNLQVSIGFRWQDLYSSSRLGGRRGGDCSLVLATTSEPLLYNVFHISYVYYFPSYLFLFICIPVVNPTYDLYCTWIIFHLL